MNPFPTYLHRYAVWTAARAAQRGFVGTELIWKVIEAVQLPERIKAMESGPVDSASFDEWHKAAAREMINAFQKRLEDKPKMKEKATYGRVAKIIAIYLKTAHVIRFPESQLSRVAHPPIDRILLHALAGETPFKGLGLRKINWTELCETNYFRLIDLLRDKMGAQPFWYLEAYWEPVAKVNGKGAK